MNITTYNKHEPTTVQTSMSAMVAVEYSELNPRGGFGVEIAQIRVLQGDKQTTFWVHVADNGHGQASCSVATERGETVTHKSVTGKWKPRRN